MSGILVITIISLAVMTCVIIGLTLFAYLNILKMAKRLTNTGALDEEFLKEEQESKSKKSKITGILGQVFSAVLALSLVTIATISGIYRIKGEQFTFKDHTSFVIASNSMETYFDDDYGVELSKQYAIKYGVSEDEAKAKLQKDQFKVGDFLTFKLIDNNEELKYYDVYGYKTSKGLIITHRLIKVNEDGTLVFRGDNAAGEDIKVDRDQVLYRYEGQRTKYIGLVVLFFGSGFGIYSVFAVLAVYVISDVVIYKWEKMKKERLDLIKKQKVEANHEKK